MTKITSLADLDQFRRQAIMERQAQDAAGHVRIFVDMGSVAIASGSSKTMKAFSEYVDTHNLDHVSVHQTANVGFDSLEPIVRVFAGDAPAVTYGKVTPEVALRILSEHVANGEMVQDHLIEHLLSQATQ